MPVVNIWAITIQEREREREDPTLLEIQTNIGPERMIIIPELFRIRWAVALRCTI